LCSAAAPGGVEAVRICFLNSYYAPDDVGGAEHSVRWLAQAMVAQGHDVTVICLGAKRSTERLEGVSVERLVVKNLYHPLSCVEPGGMRKLLWHGRDTYNRAMARDVAALLDRTRPDILHTNNLSGFSPAVWRAARDLQLPVVHTLRDYYLQCPNTAMFTGDGPCTGRCASCRVLGWPRLLATSNVQCVVGISQFILDSHLALGAFPQALRRVIPNSYRASATVKHRAVGEVLTFGFMGRLARPKGLEKLIQAVVQMSHAGRPVRLLVAGTGNEQYTQALRALAGEGPVQFTGHISQAEFFRQVHFAVVPSVWDEPFGRVVIESFAHGVPVLASRKGGLSELIRSGKTGMSFAPGERGDLNRVLGEAADLFETPGYSLMSRHCLDAAQAYTPEQVAAQYFETYRALCEDGDATFAAAARG
jgi:glycosyltransferase involved in cell wall biosynthesis